MLRLSILCTKLFDVMMCSVERWQVHAYVVTIDVGIPSTVLLAFAYVGNEFIHCKRVN